MCLPQGAQWFSPLPNQCLIHRAWLPYWISDVGKVSSGLFIFAESLQRKVDGSEWVIGKSSSACHGITPLICMVADKVHSKKKYYEKKPEIFIIKKKIFFGSNFCIVKKRRKKLSYEILAVNCENRCCQLSTM